MPYQAKKITPIDTSSLEALGKSVVDFSAWTEDEFATIASALQATEPDPILYNSPPKPRRGTTAYADGVKWNPGLGEGPYFFNGTIWTLMSRAPLGQIPGTSGTTQPGAGCIGERIQVSAVVGSLVSGTPTAANSMTLTPGIWDIEAYNFFNGPGATTSSDWVTCINTVSASLGSALITAHTRRPSGADINEYHSISRQRVALGSNTVYYLNVQATFAVSTYSCSGALWGTRVS